MRVGQAVLEEDRVRTLLECAAVLDQVQPETRALPLGANGGIGQPDFGDQVEPRELRAVREQLELAGWNVRVANAAKARGLAPLACKTDSVCALLRAALRMPARGPPRSVCAMSVIMNRA